MLRIVSLVAALVIALPSMAQDDAILTQGRERSEAFLAGELADLWDDMTPDMQAALGSLADFEAFREGLAAQIGAEVSVDDEVTRTVPEGDIYVRTGQWNGIETLVVMQWAFDREGRIAGFLVAPQPQAAESQFLEYQTQSDLRLPFDGAWHVFWGGRTIAENYHAANPAQRFAIDLVIHGEDGLSHDGNPLELESYFCWGREILAPADGLVIATVNDLQDQVIGETDTDNPLGNHVILSLAEDEYAFLAHLQAGSVRVQMGEEVEQGQVIGLCGNSGNTSEPHLHFHLQTTPDILAGGGLPAQFQNYRVNGDEVVLRGEPVRRQIVESR